MMGRVLLDDESKGKKWANRELDNEPEMVTLAGVRWAWTMILEKVPSWAANKRVNGFPRLKHWRIGGYDWVNCLPVNYMRMIAGQFVEVFWRWLEESAVQLDRLERKEDEAGESVWTNSSTQLVARYVSLRLSGGSPTMLSMGSLPGTMSSKGVQSRWAERRR